MGSRYHESDRDERPDFSRYHILPKSQDGSNYHLNLVKLVHSVHVAFHTLFDNRTPIGQFERLVGINSTALTNEFRNDVSKILLTAKENPDYIYRNGVMRPSRVN